jgi:hypothetical protein
MIYQLGKSLDQLADLKTIGIVILLALPFNIILFPWRNSRLNELSGVTDRFPDARFSYTPSNLDTLFNAYGSSGRKLYAFSEITIDLIYPILYTLLLSLLISLIFTKAFPNSIWPQRLSLLPFIILLHDYAENFSLVILALRYPNRIDWLAKMASLFTSIKWIVAGLSIILIVLGLVALAIRYIKPSGL